MSVANELRRYMNEHLKQTATWPEVLPVTHDEYWQLRHELWEHLKYCTPTCPAEFNGIPLHRTNDAKRRRAAYE